MKQATRDFAAAAPDPPAADSPWRQFAPIGALLVLLFLMRRRRRQLRVSPCW